MTPVRCTYAGYQEGFQDCKGFHLFTLLEPIPNHPFESTLAQSTIEDAGYTIIQEEAPQ